MNILLLGGTGFLGRSMATHAVTAGHAVTCLARGSHEFASGVEVILSDRSLPGAYERVDSDWDAVIDLTSHPRFAFEAVSSLRARHWTFISSTSVYVDDDRPNQGENDRVHEPLGVDAMTSAETFGPGKVACENIYRSAGPALILRPGLIGGYGDSTGRTGYYPWRFAHPTGSDVIVPDETFPVAMIDVEDLASWTVACLEESVTGTFNANGPEHTLADVYRISADLAGTGVTARAVADDVLMEHGVQPWWGPGSLPLWVPGTESRNTLIADSSAAIARGLTMRPLRQTLASVKAYHEDAGAPQCLSDEAERDLRAALDRAERAQD